MGGVDAQTLQRGKFWLHRKREIPNTPDRLSNTAVRFSLRDKWGLSVLLSVMLYSGLGEPIIQGGNQTIICL